MRFKFDENMPVEANLLFIQHGYDSETVYDENLSGCTDTVLFNQCQQEKRILITMDLDFSNSLSYSFKNSSGLIILRIKNQSKKRILDILQKIIPELDKKPIQGHIWIVEDSSLRIR